MPLPSAFYLQVYPKGAFCVTASRDTSDIPANPDGKEIMSGTISFARKWGNSLAMRVTKRVAEEAGLREKDSVEIEVREGTLVVQAATSLPLVVDPRPISRIPWALPAGTLR
jgi:hypothetical protein